MLVSKSRKFINIFLIKLIKLNVKQQKKQREKNLFVNACGFCVEPSHYNLRGSLFFIKTKHKNYKYSIK